MKIIPLSDILVAGVHCAVGIAVEVDPREGLSMVQQGFARLAPPPAALTPEEAAQGLEPAEAETAMLPPAPEAAVADPSRARRKRST
jgi:hypothetical protein